MCCELIQLLLVRAEVKKSGGTKHQFGHLMNGQIN